MCLCARMLALKWKGRAFTEKVNSKCFCWFPAAKLSTNMASPYNVTDTESSKKVREMFRQSSETVGHKDPRFGQIVYILVFCNISFSWLLTVDGFQFSIFLCRVYYSYAWRWKRRIPLSMKRIVESRLNNSGRGKTERDVSELCFL